MTLISYTSFLPPPHPVFFSPQKQSAAPPAPFNLQKDGVRVLLFRECDSRGRKLLYDSKTVLQVPVAEIPAAAAAPPSSRMSFKSSWSSGLRGSGSGSMPPVATQTTKTPCLGVKTSAATNTSYKSDAFVEISNGYGYQYRQQEGDTKLLGELVFGSVALSYRGPYTKLHILHTPLRVLLSCTSATPTSHLLRPTTASDQGIEDSSLGSSLSSWSDVACHPEGLEVPWAAAVVGGGSSGWATRPPTALSTSHSEGDSGYGGLPSTDSSGCGSFLLPPSMPNTPMGTPSSKQGSGSSLKHSGSLSSLQRRFLHTVSTSLEALGREGEVQEAGTAAGSAGPLSHLCRRPTKLGVAVTIQIGNTASEIDRSSEEWIFLHVSVIEGLINKLQTMLQAAYLHRHSFVYTVHQAVLQLQQDIVDLVSGPRLCRPIWLGLLGQPPPTERQALCTTLVDTLASLLDKFDTKQTNFFVSKLLTAVLTHHLGWVSTVTPGDHATSMTPTMTHSTPATAPVSAPGLPHPGTTALPTHPPRLNAATTATTRPSWVERLNECRPYNAVWAQLCELSGAVGYPPRAARTILVGTDTTLLAQLLTILSYIIRCSQVVEAEVGRHQLGDTMTAEHQSCPSCTSSVSSIISMVEGNRKDSQKDCGTRDAHTQQLKRESSLRRSWRNSREGRSGRYLSTEGRGDSISEVALRSGGYSAVDAQRGSACDVDPSVPGHQPLKRESDQASKWMLNDGEEIVIHDVKYSDLSHGTSRGSPSRLEPRNKELLEAERVTIVAPLPELGKSLSSCKTSTNLASLACDGSESSPGVSNFSDNAINMARQYSERLYPPLHDLDDHRETFGPVPLEPRIIADKVHKLLRVPSKCVGSQEQSQPGLSPQKSGVEKLDQFENNKESEESQSTRCVAALSRTRKSDTLGYGFVYSDESCSESLHVNQTVASSQCKERGSKKHCGTDIVERLSLDEVTVPATDIHPEIEEGGQVLYLLGDGNVLETNTPTAIEKPQIKLEAGCQSRRFWNGRCTGSAIGFEGLGVSTSEPCDNVDTSAATRVRCLPKPQDTRKVVRTRNVGRQSARDLTRLESAVCLPQSDLKHNLSLTDGHRTSGSVNLRLASGSDTSISGDLKLDSRRTSCSDDLRLAHNRDSGTSGLLANMRHHRHHSDPTNGVFACKVTDSQNCEPIKVVIEEQVSSSVKGGKNDNLYAREQLTTRMIDGVVCSGDGLCDRPNILHNGQEAISRTMDCVTYSENDRLCDRSQTTLTVVEGVTCSENERLCDRQESMPSTQENINRQESTPRTQENLSRRESTLSTQEIPNRRSTPSTWEGATHGDSVCWRHDTVSNSELTPDTHTAEDITEDTNGDEPPINVHMPRCTCWVQNPLRDTPPSSSTTSSTSSRNTSTYCSSNRSLAESLLGGVMDHYSSVFVVHATTQSRRWNDALRHDLCAAAHHSTFDQQVAEAVAVVADTNTWEVEVASSHSLVVVESGAGQLGIKVGISPLVSAITDSILDLTRLAVPPHFIVSHLEERLCEIYLKSHLLAEYLLCGSGASFSTAEGSSFIPYHLPDLTRALGLDLNDLPLLLAVASTHTPALTRMFGLSIR
ncbi:folliculin-interacting protein 1-like isoform X3 [Cherax quadricarinatus]|uniref:folliculin-interacting protein 1-like isoform X3 n=1 Tax=Cherax quadricarinatus TaxID=27406 RepID=UPI00387ED4E1